MTGIPNSITIAVALLAAFLIVITSFKYEIKSNFLRTRLMMTGFFIFIIATLTISFQPYVALTLPYTIPAFVIGAGLGYLVGVRTEQQKLHMLGFEHYMEHFAHIHARDFRNLTWWSFINFYSVMGGLILINLIGFSTVILRDSSLSVILTSTAGAFLIGTIVPYLAHLWSVSARRA